MARSYPILKKWLIYALILPIGTSSIACGASLSVIRGSDGVVRKIMARGGQETEVTKGDETIKIKTTQELWPRDLVNLSGFKQ